MDVMKWCLCDEMVMYQMTSQSIENENDENDGDDDDGDSGDGGGGEGVGISARSSHSLFPGRL